MGFPAVLIIGGLYTGLIPPWELTERERLLLAAHREANNIWASAQLSSPHYTPVVVVEWCVFVHQHWQGKQIAARSNQQKMGKERCDLIEKWEPGYNREARGNGLFLLMSVDYLCQVFLSGQK